MQERIQLLPVRRHPDRGGDTNLASAREGSKARIEEGSQDLAHPIGAEVEAEHPRGVPHALVVADDCRQHELIADIVRVGVRDHCLSVSKARPFRFHDCLIGFGYTVPDCRDP